MTSEAVGVDVGQRALTALAAVCAVLLVACGARFIARHPLPVGWDEAIYVNQVILDRDTLVSRGPSTWARKQIYVETWRPPAYRLVAAPVALLAGPSPRNLRGLALGSLIAAASLLVLAGRAIGAPLVGVLWAAGFAMAVGPFRADLLFGTEVPLYPAIAGTVYAVARWLATGSADRTTCVVLFLSMAIGALSKLTFPVVCLPFLAVAILLGPGGDRTRWKARIAVFVAAGSGLLLALPWWLDNWRDAVDYASSASAFVRHDFPWPRTAIAELLGLPLAVGVFTTALYSVLRARSLRHAADRSALVLAAACLGGSLPLFGLQVLSSNHNMRLVTPAWVLAAGLIPLTLHLGRHLSRPATVAVAMLLMIGQAGTLARSTWYWTEAQWDWSALRELTRRHEIVAPRIQFLGAAAALNPPQIEYAWRRQGEPVTVRRLWRWESGPIDWTAVDRLIDSADVVVTAETVRRREVEVGGNDNEYNDALVRRLTTPDGRWTADSLRFEGPEAMTILALVRRRTTPPT